MPKKCILVLLDGLGDRACPQLGNKTPLQAAHTPNLDLIAKLGCNGLYHPSILGKALPSELAQFLLLGYSEELFPGRGALEALGADIKLKPENVAILAHMVSLKEKDNSLFLHQDRPHASAQEVQELTQLISKYQDEEIKVEFYQTKGLFGLLILTGKVGPYITDSDPMRKGAPIIKIQPWEQYANDPVMLNTSRALSEYLLWAYYRLQSNHLNQQRNSQGLAPINGLVTQRAGNLKSVKSFYSSWGLKGLFIASGIVYKGLSKFTNLDFYQVFDSDNPGDDLNKRLRIAYDQLNTYDFIYVHSKTPDEAAHTKNPEYKKKTIESLDHGLNGILKSSYNQDDFLLVITSDHSTPSIGPLIHSGEPVPLTIIGDGVRKDKVKYFDEIETSSGSLGFVRGNEIMYLILNYLDRAKLAGIMEQPENIPFWPSKYSHFQALKTTNDYCIYYE